MFVCIYAYMYIQITTFYHYHCYYYNDHNYCAYINTYTLLCIMYSNQNIHIRPCTDLGVHTHVYTRIYTHIREYDNYMIIGSRFSWICQLAS